MGMYLLYKHVQPQHGRQRNSEPGADGQQI